MYYISTRDTAPEKTMYSAAQAICHGLAPDGGLFVPNEIPHLDSAALKALCPLTYAQRAAAVLGLYLTDFSAEELLSLCRSAYSEESFPAGAAPVRTVDETTAMLELWHGPTCAFKDMALQLMPKLLVASLQKTGERRCAYILVATSGDTGKAALEGFRDVAGTKILVFYPQHGVSDIQKLQMQTQTGENVCVVAIDGNFDDAQSGVKRLFADEALAKELHREGVFFSSANSINWGRLAPQIAYYVSAYCDMCNQGRLTPGDTLDVCVPTGNFGNILAAYFAKRMGLPLGRLVCASNRNHVLTDFFQSGKYDRNRPFYTTSSPSMDILISSNLERLLYLLTNAEYTSDCMRRLNEMGFYEISDALLQTLHRDFIGAFADETTCAEAIRTAFAKNNLLIDPHTAVAYACAKQYQAQTGSDTPMLIVSTASPYKFAQDVLGALDQKKHPASFLTMEMLSAQTETEIPLPLKALKEKTVRFTATVGVDQMKQCVLEFARD